MALLTDQDLYKALEGSGEVLSGFRVFYIKRHGYLLLALPLDREAARATLNLYQPQAFLARSLMVFISILITFNLHRLLPSLSITIRKNSVLAPMHNHAEEIGFLLGNPEAESRRAIILCKNEGGYFVDKVGLSEKARLSVVRELEIINSLPKCNVGLPVIFNHFDDGVWASYRTRYLSGRAPAAGDESRIVLLLRDWLSHSTSIKLGETEQWKLLCRYAEENQERTLLDRVANASSLEIAVGVFHGDFAPWNIKLSEDGGIHIMDWEYGHAEGPAGWDWLHYMIQRASLVQNLSSAEILKLCRAWAASSEGSEFLADAGWGGEVECWLGSYLLYSSWIAGFDRTCLISEWIQS